METDSSFIGGDSGDHSRGQNSNLTNNAWDIWDMSVTNHGTRSSRPEPSVINALLFGHLTNTTTAIHGVGTDPHMMCLKLGKRHYCEDADRHVAAESSSSAAAKTGISFYDATKTGPRSPTRCQVEGCNVALGSTKEYYRRHKVCEMHSKAPKVVVSGVQQRFCQQCSRFHEVTEFDEAKRSCRRRLEGHNLRRRKGTLSNSLPPNFLHSQENNSVMKRRLGPLSTLSSSSSLSMPSSESSPVCALSLLSSPKTEPLISSCDLSSRCRAALYELIVANRATYASGHFLNQNSSHQQISDETVHVSHDTQMWNRFNHTTMPLDLKEKSKEPEEWTDYCWSNFGGANVV